MNRILFVLSQREPACLKGVKQAISQSQGLEFLEISSVAEAITVAQTEFTGLVVLSVTGKEDLLGAIEFLKAQGESIKRKKSVRVLVFNNIPNPKLESTLTGMGCSEILGFEASGKAVLHKMQRHLKLVQSPVVSGAAPEKTKSRVDIGSSFEEDLGAPKAACKLVEPLAHPADFWLIRHKLDAKKIMGRWMVEMIGPGPAVGEWVQVPLGAKEKQKAESAFEWKARETGEAFATTGGRWIFLGRQVEFVWRINRWRFAGDRISLTFQENGRIIASRFEVEGPNLIKVAANSDIAKARLPDIEATFSGSMRMGQREDVARDGGDLRCEVGPEREGRELSISLDPENEGKELSIKLDPEREGKELSIELDPERESEELSIDLDQEGPEGAFNDLTDSPGPRLPNFNDHGTRSKNLFNFGRGVTQGQKSDHVSYEPEDFSTSADAFKPIGLRATLEGMAAEVLETSESQIRLGIISGRFEPRDKTQLNIFTENLSPPGSLTTKCTVLSVGAQSEGGSDQVEVQLNSEDEQAWAGILDAVTMRQMNILRFLKMAKGV